MESERDGLSPRVRGNLCDDVLDRMSIRSIPACAGEPLLTAAALILGRHTPPAGF